MADILPFAEDVGRDLGAGGAVSAFRDELFGATGVSKLLGDSTVGKIATEATDLALGQSPEVSTAAVKFSGPVFADQLDQALAEMPQSSLVAVEGYEGGATTVRSVTLGKFAPNEFGTSGRYWDGKFELASPDEIGIGKIKQLPTGLLIGPERYAPDAGAATADYAKNLLGSNPTDPVFVGFDKPMTVADLRDVLSRVKPGTSVGVAGYESGIDNPVAAKAGTLTLDANQGVSYYGPHEFTSSGQVPETSGPTAPAVILTRPHSLTG